MVNPDHARPLVAFGLLAAAAAVITATGLQPSHAPTSAGAAPVRASTSAAPELVLGGVLRARPDAVLSNPLSPELWTAGSEANPGPAVQVAPPSSPTTTHKARTKSGASQQGSAAGSHPSQTSTEPVSAVGGGHGKGRGKQDEPATTTATATATATPSHPGKGGGRPDTAGH